jgi:hypothetical protein
VREHRLRELVEHQSHNGLIFVARCTCGWSGSACFHTEANARREHEVHAMRFIDGSETVECCFCGDRVPARLSLRLFADQFDQLRYLCAACQESSAPEPSAARPEFLEARDDLIALERELRAC